MHNSYTVQMRTWTELKHGQDAPEPVSKHSWVLLEILSGIWSKTEVSSTLRIGWMSILQKLIVTSSTPNRKLMAQQTDFCSELPSTHTDTQLSYLQLKHVNRSARKNWCWLFHVVNNLDVKFFQLSAAFSFPLQTRKGRESGKVKITILY